MNHIPALIKDLALILSAAGFTTLLFKKLKQPVVLGYIIAGILISPNFKFFPNITETSSINIWAEIGVIFLLFSLGLEFSFKKLVQVGSSASITALVEVVLMLTFGYFTGQLLGWSFIDSIFLGGILSVSSTTIIIRAIEELGIKHKSFVSLVFGALIVEDIVAIALMVLLTTLAVSKQFSGVDMLFSIGKLGFFLVLIFLVGIYLLPTFLKKTKKFMNDETLLIVSLALCLLMVLLASGVGFSPALGAFIMGSLLAETQIAEKVEHLVSSVKNLFGAIFFVSVGMLIDPHMLVQYGGPILLISVVTIVGKIISTMTGALLSGQPLNNSVQAGFSLAQIGEFSFIIATLGLTLKVTSGFLYPIAVAVSALTTFTTPYLIKSAEPFANWLQKKLPAIWMKALNRYSNATRNISVESEWKTILKKYIGIIAINTIMIAAFIILAYQFLLPFMLTVFDKELLARSITAVITLTAISPFLWALAIRKLRKGSFVALEVLRILVAILLLGAVQQWLFSFWAAVIGTLVVTPLLLYIFRIKLENSYTRIRERFLYNLNEKERLKRVKDNLSPWDAHIVYYEVSPNADYLGIPLEQLAWREKYGVNITSLERGEIKTYAPDRYARLFPFDKIGILGTDVQLQTFKPVIETTGKDMVDQPDLNVILQKLVISEHGPLKDLTIRSSGIREKTNGLVVGIERGRQRILNPSSDTPFKRNDVVWIVADARKMEQFTKSVQSPLLKTVADSQGDGKGN
ncbi:cation:proton antiporter domain-containing protein [Flavitalea flava]